MPDAMGQARRAYSAARETVRSPRRVEYEALATITARLRATSQDGESGYANFVGALHDNRRIWSFFAVQAAGQANPLPEALRAGLISLAGFVQQHSSKVLARTATVEPLLEINTAIMRGLHDGAT